MPPQTAWLNERHKVQFEKINVLPYFVFIIGSTLGYKSTFNWYSTFIDCVAVDLFNLSIKDILRNECKNRKYPHHMQANLFNATITSTTVFIVSDVSLT